MFSSHLRNHAKTARMIAAFGNLYISRVRWRKPEPRRVVIGDVSWTRSNEVKIDMVGRRSGRNIEHRTPNIERRTLGIGCWKLDVRCWMFSQNRLDNRPQLTDLIQANKCVHFGQRFAQLASEPLRQAAAYDQFLIRSPVQNALIMRLENRFDRFFLG